MKPFLYYALILVHSFIGASEGRAQTEPLAVSKEELPRIPATEPDDALATFELHPGFRLKLAAHEPDICDPIAMTFDERGRAYVLEMRGYSERRDEALGRVRLLTDVDGDGVFDHSVVFKDGLRWPTAITCYKGGVFVGATPDLFYFKDVNDDGIADGERIVFTGFGGGNPKLNMQALFNSLRWGPDNRIWGATAANGGKVTRPGNPSFGPVSLRGADFSFDPEKLDLRPENGTAQYGMSFDSKGRRFVCSNSRHLIHVAYERQHVRANPFSSLPPALVDIPADGSAAPVYRISPDEPWRIVRTRWRVSGVVPGIVEGGGRVSGYFTSATGVHIYWGSAYGSEFQDNAFIGDVGSNLVHRKVIGTKPAQVGLVARRADPDSKTEFLRSRDNWFRPTSFATGPDGCLYLTDMYREVIEHPWSIPEPIKKRLDLNSGFERGRIYRVEPTNGEVLDPVDLGTFTTAQLRSLASHPNDWHQTTARRLLFERGTPQEKKPPVRPFPALLSSASALHGWRDKAAKDPWIRAAYLQSMRSPEDLLAAWKREQESTGRDLAKNLLLAIKKTANEELTKIAIHDLSARDLSLPTAEEWETLLLASSPQFEKLVRENIRTRPPKKLLALARSAIEQLPSKESTQIAAVRLVSLLGNEDDLENLKALFLRSPSETLRSEVANRIGDTEFLIRHFERIPKRSISTFSQAILKDPEMSLVLLERVRSKNISPETLPRFLVEGLCKHPDSSIQRAASSAFPQLPSRREVIASYQSALDLRPSIENGKVIFGTHCASCHKATDGMGVQVGPDTATFSKIGPQALLTRILDPNREVAPQFQTYLFTLEDGTSFSGIISSETTTTVRLLLPGGATQTFPRDHVTSMKGVGRSLMPEGLEAALSHQDLADLIGFLESESPVR